MRRRSQQPLQQPFRRRLVGLNVIGNSPLSPPSVQGIYEEDILERGVLSSVSVRGISVQGRSSAVDGKNKKERDMIARMCRPDLYWVIRAAGILCDQLSGACLSLDAAAGKGEFDPSPDSRRKR